MLKLFARYVYLRLRMIGHTHRYHVVKPGMVIYTKFCVICGKYPDR